MLAAGWEKVARARGNWLHTAQGKRPSPRLSATHTQGDSLAPAEVILNQTQKL